MWTLLMLKSVVCLAIVLQLHSKQAVSSNTNEIMGEKCGAYGFYCVDHHTYHICKIPEDYSVDTDILSKISNTHDKEEPGGAQDKDDEEEGICPNNTKCDETKAIYCSPIHFFSLHRERREEETSKPHHDRIRREAKFNRIDSEDAELPQEDLEAIIEATDAGRDNADKFRTPNSRENKKAISVSELHSKLTDTSSEPKSFHCCHPGNFPDPSCNYKYYFCDISKDGQTLIPVHKTCKKKEVFDPSVHECIIWSSLHPPGMLRTRRSQTCTEKLPDFFCTSEGNFPDPRNPSKYFACYRKSDGCDFITVHYCCGNGKLFDHIERKCVSKCTYLRHKHSVQGDERP